MKKVITYQAPDSSTLNLTPAQVSALEKAGRWPRNTSGEYCTVSHGLHSGEPSCETNLLSDILAL